MTTVFPGAIDSLPRPAGSTKRNASGFELSVVVDNISDAIEATETKLGATPASGDLCDWVLAGNAAGKGIWVPAAAVGTNLIVNGSCEIDQRVGPYTTTNSRNNDALYTLDRIILLSDGNNVVDIAQEGVTSNIPTGSRGAIKATVVTANKKFGICFLLERAVARAIIGGVCSLQYKVRTVTANPISNSREAILAWAGTADAPTKDVVSTTNWNAAGSNPTFATNYTLENTPVNRALTNAWQTFNVDNVAIDTASTSNVALFFWSDDTTTTAGDIIYWTDFSLVPGPKALPIHYYDPALEREASYRWLFCPTTEYLGNAKSGSTLYAEVTYWPTQMRAIPTVSSATYSASTGNAGTPTINNVGNRTARPVNLGAAWTVDAQISWTAVVSAELGV